MVDNPFFSLCIYGVQQKGSVFEDVGVLCGSRGHVMCARLGHRVQVYNLDAGESRAGRVDAVREIQHWTSPVRTRLVFASAQGRGSELASIRSVSVAGFIRRRPLQSLKATIISGSRNERICLQRTVVLGSTFVQGRFR
jgi:hypothetical protein